MLISSELDEATIRAASTPALAITRCSNDVVEVDLTNAHGTARLDDIEHRLMQFVGIGFRTIEVSVNDTIATDPDMTSMLTRIAGLLAATNGQLTIRTSTTKLIG